MKKVLHYVLLFSILIIIAGCKQKIILSDHLTNPSYYGLSSNGEADLPTFNRNSLLSVIEDTVLISNIMSDVTITLDQQTNLTNGDTITATITVPKYLEKVVEGGTIEFTVTGLEEPTIISAEDINKHLVVTFSGISGKGVAYIDNTFADPIMQNINFTVENNGALINGDEVKIILDEYGQDYLLDNHYVLDTDTQVFVEVHGLQEIAATASEIANLEELKLMLNEEVLRYYQDDSWTKYEITFHNYMYRQFPTGNSNGDFYYSETNSGTFIGIYTIKQYSANQTSKLENEETAIFGYSDIILDADNNANIADVSLVSSWRDRSYSLEAVLKLYQGYGYQIVE